MILNDVNIEEKHAHAVAAVLVRYPRDDTAIFLSADEILQAFVKSSLRTQRYFNVEVDDLKVAFACSCLRICRRWMSQER